MSFDELSTVSKNLVALRCDFGFDFDTSIVDISELIFPFLEKVVVKSKKNSDLQFIATVLENSIPQSRGVLKSLFLGCAPAENLTDVYVDYRLLASSLIKVVKV
jgi:hypothetical protein